VALLLVPPLLLPAVLLLLLLVKFDKALYIEVAAEYESTSKSDASARYCAV
jgi:hypothetical protein